MVEAGKMRLVETRPAEKGAVCVFETGAGDTLSVAWPAMSETDLPDTADRASYGNCFQLFSYESLTPFKQGSDRIN